MKILFRARQIVVGGIVCLMALGVPLVAAQPPDPPALPATPPALDLAAQPPDPPPQPRPPLGKIQPAPKTPPAPAAAPAQPAPPAPPAPPVPQGLPVNVKIEATISDQRGGAPPIKKTVSITLGDRESGSIRSEVFVVGVGSLPLHVDASPMILLDGSNKIRLRIGLEYDLGDPEPGKTGPLVTKIRENARLVLESGKPMIVSQSADPMSDRMVTVEVKATILK